MVEEERSVSEFLQVSRHEDVLVATINNPPVNALSPGVLDAVAGAVREAREDSAIRAVVIIGAGRTFIAGADIREFPKIISGERPKLSLNPLLAEIEDCPKPVIMAIHGTALGGGLETAMAGHYRVAVESAQFGQPEVKLGLIPGAGGTQRLPRLCGVEKALRMCVLGEPIRALEAHAAGLIDQIVEGDLLAGSIDFARRAAAPRRTRDLPVNPATEEQLEQIRSAASAKLRGQTAPLAAIESVCASAAMSFDEGLENERRIFEQCLLGPQAKALIHVFFGEREVAKIPLLPKDVEALPIRGAAIVGAGTMGRGIAMAFANAGVPVLLTDRTQADRDRAIEHIRGIYDRSVRNGRFSSEEAAARLARITPVSGHDGFDSVDLIVEAVFEDMDAKLAVFRELDTIARPGCILASNTSTLDIDRIASATARPEWVAGLHFFSPANVMRLLEVVRGANTSHQVIATAMELGRRLKKIPVLAGNCFGFIGNRMFGPYREAAVRCAEQGASPWQIDRALEEWGMAMGPLAVGDLAGIDIAAAVRRASAAGSSFEDVLFRNGRFGQKTGAGWYLYAQSGRHPDHATENLLAEYAAQQGIPQRTFTDEEIVDACIGALRAEGRKVLEDGIALRSVDIDMVYVHGYGFPAWRGGPMFEP